MNAAPAAQREVVADVVRRFGLTSLLPTLRTCEALAGDDAPLDVAVLGQFKSGKSSLLNAVLGEAVFPVGALPVTAVVTRAAAGPERVVRVTRLDGSVEEVAPARLADFVTEAGNPGNRRQVARVDVLTPALADLPGVRLVDTPGLGSVFAHNTEATRAWMPNAAAALVTVSAERPLSDEDRRLVGEARQTAPRVVVVLTKVDLLTDAECAEVTAFLEQALRESFGVAVPVPGSLVTSIRRSMGGSFTVLRLYVAPKSAIVPSMLAEWAASTCASSSVESSGRSCWASRIAARSVNPASDDTVMPSAAVVTTLRIAGLKASRSSRCSACLLPSRAPAMYSWTARV